MFAGERPIVSGRNIICQHDFASARRRPLLSSRNFSCQPIAGYCLTLRLQSHPCTSLFAKASEAWRGIDRREVLSPNIARKMTQPSD